MSCDVPAADASGDCVAAEESWMIFTMRAVSGTLLTGMASQEISALRRVDLPVKYGESGDVRLEHVSRLDMHSKDFERGLQGCVLR